MTTETCTKCGHHKVLHFKSGCSKTHNPDGELEHCECEKFIPQNTFETPTDSINGLNWKPKDLKKEHQNHSPQEKESSNSFSLAPEDTEPSSNNEGGSDNASSLSDKKQNYGHSGINFYGYPEEDVKESVQKLKEIIMNLPTKRFYNRRVCEEIDKIFGSALI